MSDPQAVERTFGPNDWLVDEMYEQYLEDPSSVSESWQEFFADYRRGGGNGQAVATAPAPAPPPAPAAPAEPAAPAATAPVPKPEAAPAAEAKPAPAGAVQLRGAASRIAQNMERSLELPTATSVRTVPAKLLEVNRKIVNNYLARTRGGKISFTHLIGYAMVKAIGRVPAMNRSYVEVDGKPGVVDHEHVGLGLAVDVEKSDGSRTLLVPVVMNADTLDFRAFWLAYEDLIRKVRNNKITPADFDGTTVSLTNPGTIGTVHSVPRLMPGQGVILGVGTIDYPAEYSAADPDMLAKLGVSKVITLTSTYDHRIIQGAESGLFLRHIHELLLGEDGFYDDVFQSLGVPYEPVRWRRDVNPVDEEAGDRAKQVHVQTLINTYRVRGHLIADLDPLRWKKPKTHPELDPATYGLTLWDLDREYFVDGIAGHEMMTLGDLLGLLRDAYCRSIGVEYMHIQEPDQKRWIQEHVEGVQVALSPDDQRHILGLLNSAEAFERFLNTKYMGHKRFGIDGSESAIVIIDAILGAAADDGLDGAVMGMAHRGRLNVLAKIVGKSLREIFREFEGDIDPETIQGSGDVKYHKGAQGKFVSQHGNELPLTLASNPSHLEAVDPVVEGMARAMQDRVNRPESFSILPFIVHGDAAFAGQGVVAEVFNLSQLRGYRTGGTVHLIVNNQVGFTTPPEAARSSTYATDVAKMVQAPIFHVNGDDPEACVRVARLAYEFRQAFHKDVVIDMVCYRRLGHNEGDEPSYTQPLMYKRIEERRSVRKLYTEALVNRGDITLEEAEAALEDFQSRLAAALEETRSTAPPKGLRARPAPEPLGVLPRVETGVSREVLDRVAAQRFRVPDGFTVHPKLAKQLEAHRKMYDGDEVDWALGEFLSFGSLLLEGSDIRVAGQDTRRGTFSQRHAVLVDYETADEYTPLRYLGDKQGQFWIYDSSLSEYAALGFEYGYSVAAKDVLVAWEAQFGDFVNGAQIVIDQFIAAAEDKWQQTSGLVLLLPHGYEGQGPEHSSARIERFLTLSADDNLQVVNATTAAQYFHVLRRQLHRDIRKPLVIFTPKSLLRAREARSPIAALETGSFQEVLGDPFVEDVDAVRRVVLCSGKVGYDVMKARDAASAPVAVVRVEQLYPWPGDQIADAVARYPNVTSVVWVQEEPENMGPWPFAGGRLSALFADRYDVTCSTRRESGSPATGSLTVHQQEQEELVARALNLAG